MRTDTLTLTAPQTVSIDHMLKLVLLVMKKGFDQLCEWQRRYNERRHLATLEPHLITDAGLSEDAIAAEAAKPFWQN